MNVATAIFQVRSGTLLMIPIASPFGPKNPKTFLSRDPQSFQSEGSSGKPQVPEKMCIM